MLYMLAYGDAFHFEWIDLVISLVFDLVPMMVLVSCTHDFTRALQSVPFFLVGVYIIIYLTVSSKKYLRENFYEQKLDRHPHLKALIRNPECREEYLWNEYVLDEGSPDFLAELGLVVPARDHKPTHEEAMMLRGVLRQRHRDRKKSEGKFFTFGKKEEKGK